MESKPDPTYIADRIEPEVLRESHNALKLKTCPFCGGMVKPRWAPWLDGAPCYEIEHIDIERAVAAKCPIEMSGYDSLEQLQRVWNTRRPESVAGASSGDAIDAEA
ncbi:hypothetical protein [Collinsella aerofaciens]|uniref:hypothetical protein n=1 Tax=Collinsella aerofaciens TaxID=74426 RepID=UPI003D7A77B0